ncbi:hypothetical protein BDU57DRAFT_299575 [Ampelomyces quisqualis]|uniref:Uncharacterized protein n=1 Tax=Ampelomyces quisqualis TaxID=50730 RepID=A0A6A5QIF7_AMPQU|nr:hypothetical protein BDU57DRAFT_299575 [Ampelomyces quisqualis]
MRILGVTAMSLAWTVKGRFEHSGRARQQACPTASAPVPAAMLCVVVQSGITVKSSASSSLLLLHGQNARRRHSIAHRHDPHSLSPPTRRRLQ